MDPLSRRVFLLAAASGLLAACGDADDPAPTAQSTSPVTEPPTPTAPISAPPSTVERTTPPPGTATEGVVAADRAFAADLFGIVSADVDTNFIFSPYSIATAFSMTQAGAAGDTDQQMREVLGIGADAAAWHVARNALDVAIRTPSSVFEGTTPLELDVTNAPFAQVDFEFLDAFIMVLAEQYGADVSTLDFRSDPDAARVAINAFVVERTQGRITDLLPAGSITALARLVLVNTVFFSAQWLTPFDAASTRPGAFMRLDDTSVDADTMHANVRTTYATGASWQMVRLPYWGGYSMTVIVADAGRFDDVADLVATGLLDEVRSINTDVDVDLALPKFDFASPVELIAPMQQLGMVDAFDNVTADFSKMTTADELYISAALHQATIEVDEIGTTATAATAVVASIESQPESAILAIDRPFIFVIEHDDTGEPLFVGRVVDPTA